jgi:enoyl-CoA hydratase/carnithine racemase
MAERKLGDVHEESEGYDPALARRIITRLLDIDKPTICAINGDAVGLAATIALLCDITVASQTARIGDTHVSRVGLVAGDGGTVIWPLLVGVSRAKEFLMRGTLINGAEAERIGLVNHAVPKDDVLATAREIALELSHGPAWAIRWTKLSVNQVLKQRLNLMLEASWALETVSADTDDHREATRAFAERRKPRFTGR